MTVSPAVVDFPTPPLPEATAMIFLTPGKEGLLNTCLLCPSTVFIPTKLNSCQCLPFLVHIELVPKFGLYKNADLILPKREIASMIAGQALSLANKFVHKSPLESKRV